LRITWLIGLALGPALLSACHEVPKKTLSSDSLPVARTVEVTTDTTPSYINAVGSVAVREETPLGFTSAGQIARLYVHAGDRVRRGQLLAELDVTNVAASSERADAEFDRATAEYNRLQTLFREGWVTRQRLETAEAAVRVAKADRAAAKFAYNTSRIIAPTSGIVLARLAEPAQIVTPGMPVVVFGKETSGYVLRVSLTDSDLMALQLGTSADVNFESWGGQLLQGRVIEIAARSDQATGTYQVEIALPFDRRLRSGLVGIAKIKAAHGAAASQLIVPPAALFSARSGEGFVYVIDDKRVAHLRKVQIGTTDDIGTRLVGGIAQGERVAITALDQLRDGIRISGATAVR
jgi:RND family efflux transporter MFP subunit